MVGVCARGVLDNRNVLRGNAEIANIVDLAEINPRVGKEDHAIRCGGLIVEGAAHREDVAEMHLVREDKRDRALKVDRRGPDGLGLRLQRLAGCQSRQCRQFAQLKDIAILDYEIGPRVIGLRNAYGRQGIFPMRAGRHGKVLDGKIRYIDRAGPALLKLTS